MRRLYSESQAAARPGLPTPPATSRMSPVRPLVVAFVLLAAAPPAHAARVRLDTHTGALAYPVIGRDGLLVLDERVFQSRLLLLVDDILPAPEDSPDPSREPDLALGCSLRWFANPGMSAASVEPTNMHFVPSITDMSLEVL